MKAQDDNTKIYLQKLEQERALDPSKMDSHWCEFEKMMQIPSRTTWLDKLLKYRAVMLGNVTFLVILLLSVFFFTRRDKIDNQPSHSRIEHPYISKSKPEAPDTSSIDKAIDTTIKPAKKLPRKKPFVFSTQVVTPAAPDTIFRIKEKKLFFKRKLNNTYEEAPDTSSIDKAVDTINKPAKKLPRKKPFVFSTEVATPAAPDTISGSKEKKLFFRRKSNKNYE